MRSPVTGGGNGSGMDTTRGASGSRDHVVVARCRSGADTDTVVTRLAERGAAPADLAVVAREVRPPSTPSLSVGVLRAVVAGVAAGLLLAILLGVGVVPGVLVGVGGAVAARVVGDGRGTPADLPPAARYDVVASGSAVAIAERELAEAA